MRWRVRLYWLSEHHLSSRLPKFEQLHSWLWLQVLRPGDLEEITRISYSGEDGGGFASQRHNFWGLWDWEAQAFADALTGCTRVLVIGAGAGREMIALAKMGYEVLGIEPSQDLVEAGRRNLGEAGLAADILRVSPTHVPPDIGMFDAAVIGRGVYHHIPRAARRIQFLQDCRDHLGPSAPLVVGDFHVRRDRGRARFSLAGRFREERGDYVGQGFFHFFSRPEITHELEAAGFEIVQYRPTPFPGESSLAHLLARTRR